MRPHTLFWKITSLLLISFSLFTNSATADSTVENKPFKNKLGKLFVHPRPVGYDQYLTYVANGLFDPNIQPDDPDITNCDGATNLCDGYHFQKEILGRNDMEIAIREEQAIEYFDTAFGMDFNDPANAGRLFLRTFQIDPRINLHVVSMAGRNVPREGWPMTDGGWILIVIDPNGFELSGEFEGEVAPFGSFVLFTEYHIVPTRTVRRGNRIKRVQGKPIVMDVRSLSIQEPGENGFKCAIETPDFGVGLVQGWNESIFREDGLKKTNVSAFLSFPGLGDVPLAN